MATQLNIKDPVLIERVRDLAKRDGQSVTAKLRTIVDSEWKAQEANNADQLARMIEFTRELQAAVPAELRHLTSKEVMNSIYDDNELDGFAR